jgi:DNA ligase (NAD+)
LLAAIERSRRAELWRFIHGLGIPQIGPVNSRRLAETCGGLESLATWDEAKLAAVLGAAAARSVADFLAQPQGRAELQALVDQGVRPSAPKLPATATRFRGKVFAFTGTLPGLTREEAMERVRAAGGIVRDEVTSATTCLVAGKEPGQKANEARRLGIAIIPAEDFLRLLESE